MLPLVGSEMMSDAISHKCRTSGQEWGEEITDGFQNLGRQACDGQCGGQAELRLEHTDNIQLLGPTQWLHLGPEWSSPPVSDYTTSVPLAPGHQGHMTQKAWGPTLGLFTYQSAWSSHQPSQLRLLHLQNKCSLSSHPIWP